MANPVGRPSDYNREIAELICEEIENSIHGIEYICEHNENFPSGRTVRRWLKQIQEFRPLYAQAKEAQADKVAEETIVIAYDDKRDWKTIIDEEGNEKNVFVAEAVNRARLKIDTLKWHASKLAPKKYGDRTMMEHDVKVKQEDAVKDLA